MRQNDWWDPDYGFFDRDYVADHRIILEEETTASQAAFLRRVLADAPGNRVVDLAGGFGRHLLALGPSYSRTLVDLSSDYIELARNLFSRNAEDLDTICADIRDPLPVTDFDAAISMCTSFGFFDDEDNENVLRNVFSALVRDGLFLLDLDNRERTIRRFSPQQWYESERSYVLRESSLDLETSRYLESFIRIRKNDGSEKRHRISIRMYTLNEITRLLEWNGFGIEAVYGGYEENEYGIDSPRMIVKARKKGGAA